MAKIDFDRDLKVWARTGTVVGATKWSETKVSSYTTGGGGHLHGGTGYVAPARSHVSSSSTEVSQYFLQLADGKEISFKSKNDEMAVRDGQKMTVLFAKLKGQEMGTSVWHYNHMTESSLPDDGGIDSLLGRNEGCVWSAGIFIVSFMVSYFILNSAVLGIILGISAAFYFAWRRQNQQKKIRREFVARLRRRVEEVVAEDMAKKPMTAP